MTELDAAQLALLGRCADELMPPASTPAGWTAPTASALVTQPGEWERLERLRPDLIEPVITALATIEAQDGSLFALRDDDSALFDAVADAVASLYLTTIEVMRAFGYEGRRPLPLEDLQRREEEMWSLTAGVRDRGWIWKHTAESEVTESEE